MAEPVRVLRKKLREADAEAFLINKPQNIYFLSGLDATSASILITKRDAYLIVDSRYYLKAKAVSSFNVVLLKGKLSKFLKDFMKDKSIKKVAFESNYVTYKNLRALKKGSAVKFVEADSWVEEIRREKQTKEIKAIKEAARLADKAIAFAKHRISLGTTEIELAKRIECFIRKNGGRKESFETIVASGPNSALPHHSSGNRTIKPGDILSIDLGAVYKKYVSDVTRTFLLEPVRPAVKKIYMTCLEAQEKALKKVRAGAQGKEIDKAARECIDESYPLKFSHNLGHGIGLEVHEAPVIGPKQDLKLVENMVITVEPGIYLQRLGGVRIEDMVLVTKEGRRSLTKSPKKLDEIIIEC